MTPVQKIRILIADDHDLIRDGLETAVANQADMQVVALACDGAEAVELALAFRPDAILLDLVMPKLDGVAALKAIRLGYPKARALMLSGYSNDKQIESAFKAGALGYMVKGAPRDQLLQAIRVVASGRLWNKLTTIPQKPPAPGMRRYAAEVEAPPLLSTRENQALRLIARGYSNEEIALEMHISEQTAAKYVSIILNKLNLANRTQAALYALRSGIAKLD